MHKALFAVAAVALLAAPAGAQDAFKHDAWESWNSFGVGSSVEFSMEMSGMKMGSTKAVEKKTDAEITLKTESIMTMGGKETRTPGNESVKKPAGGATDGECALCKKKYSEHKDEGKWSKEKVKVGDKEIECHKYDTAAKMCNGQDMPKSTIWYSKEVPGWMVKMQTAQMTMTAVKFEAKK